MSDVCERMETLLKLADIYFRCCDSDPERAAAIKEQYRELAGIEQEVHT